MAETDPLQAVRAALARRPGFQRNESLRIGSEDGVVVLNGMLENIAAKRLIPRLAVEASGGLGVMDRLRVKPQEERDDAELAAAIERSLSQEPLFADYQVTSQSASRHSLNERMIGVRAADGVIELVGRVESLCHRRLAEVLSWWSPGCADVNNHLYVTPPERDSDAAINEAVRLALEKDPRIDAAHIAGRTIDRVVMLIGTLPVDEQKQIAEDDAWYVAGVHGVDNRIRVYDRQGLDQYADEASRESFPASDPPSMTPVVGVGGAAGRESEGP